MMSFSHCSLAMHYLQYCIEHTMSTYRKPSRDTIHCWDLNSFLITYILGAIFDIDAIHAELICLL